MRKTNSYKRSTYSYWFGDNILFIEDEDKGGMSVTNNIEGILDKIETDEKVDLAFFKIIYKDTMGVWDGISVFKINEEITVDFYPLQCKELVDAIEKLDNL